jgi:outer membrane protein assembly factor BamB
MLGACLGAEQKTPLRSPIAKKKLKPEPAPLFPAVQAWLVPFNVATSAGGAMDADRVYVPLQSSELKSGELKALDRETGVEVWAQPVETIWPPIVSDGVVYVAEKETIRSLDARTGEQLDAWPIDGALAAPLTSHAGWLVAPLESRRVQARREHSDGKPDSWTVDLSSRSRHRAAAGTDALYFALEDGRVVALNLSGDMLWEKKLPGTLSEPAVAADRVLVGSTNNFFYALDAETGKLEWKWRAGGDVIGAAADKGVVYFASLDNILRAVNRGNGNQRWKTVIATRPAIPPRTFGGLVVMTGVAPETSAFNAETGQANGSYVAPSELQGAPLIDPVLKPYRVAIVAITRDGRVIGLRPQAMLFEEPPLAPLQSLPGRRLPRESLSTSNSGTRQLDSK